MKLLVLYQKKRNFFSQNQCTRIAHDIYIINSYIEFLNACQLLPLVPLLGSRRRNHCSLIKRLRLIRQQHQSSSTKLSNFRIFRFSSLDWVGLNTWRWIAFESTYIIEFSKYLATTYGNNFGNKTLISFKFLFIF